MLLVINYFPWEIPVTTQRTIVLESYARVRELSDLIKNILICVVKINEGVTGSGGSTLNYSPGETPSSAHITPILADLHWLRVAYRIKFKIILLTFKDLNGLAPYFLWIYSSPILLLVHYGPLILAFSPSLGIASLPWVADLSVLLPLNSETLYQDHSVLPIACLNSNHSSKLICFQNVIFLGEFLFILSYVV